jgi:hypothetical protein
MVIHLQDFLQKGVEYGDRSVCCRFNSINCNNFYSNSGSHEMGVIYMRINKLKIARFIVFLIILALLAVKAFSMPQKQVEYVEYCIASGETYWSVAEQYQDRSGYRDIRRFVFEIEKVTGIGAGELRPGDMILIPVKR